MKTVLKPGGILKARLFICDVCGCIVETDEYEVKKDTLGSTERPRYIIKCDMCDRIVVDY